MNIREALINQQPSLAGWREAQAEIARLDAFIHSLRNRNDSLKDQLNEANDRIRSLEIELEEQGENQ